MRIYLKLLWALAVHAFWAALIISLVAGVVTLAAWGVSAVAGAAWPAVSLATVFWVAWYLLLLRYYSGLTTAFTARQLSRSKRRSPSAEMRRAGERDLDANSVDLTNYMQQGSTPDIVLSYADSGVTREDVEAIVRKNADRYAPKRTYHDVMPMPDPNRPNLKPLAKDMPFNEAVAEELRTAWTEAAADLHDIETSDPIRRNA